MNATLKTLSEQEFQTLIRYYQAQHPTAAEQTHALRDLCCLHLGFDAGLRVGEMLCLRVGHVLFNGEVLRSVALAGECTKTGVDRTVPLTDRTRQLLGRFLSRLPGWPQINGDRALFYSIRTGDPITVRAFQMSLARHSKACLGRVITPHQLRHSYATRMMRLVDMRTVQALLGHASIRSTQIYTHPSQDDLQGAVNSLNCAIQNENRPPK